MLVLPHNASPFCAENKLFFADLRAATSNDLKIVRIVPGAPFPRQVPSYLRYDHRNYDAWKLKFDSVVNRAADGGTKVRIASG